MRRRRPTLAEKRGSVYTAFDEELALWLSDIHIYTVSK